MSIDPEPTPTADPPRGWRAALGLWASDVAVALPHLAGASGWSLYLTALRDPSLRDTLLFRVISTSRGRGPLWWRTVSIWWKRCELYQCEVGPGLRVLGLRNTVIGPGVRMGSGVTIHPCVSIGAAGTFEPWEPIAYPTVGDGVTLESGALVGGGITIGDHSHIGRDALVLRSLPPGTRVEDGEVR